MDWTPIYATLSQIAVLSGLSDPKAIVWSQQPGASAFIIGPGTGAKFVMTVRTVTSQGHDYEEKLPPVAGANQIVTVVGNRQFIWSVRADAQTGDPAKFALMYLENLRTRLSRATTQEILAASGVAGLAVVEPHATQETSYVDKDSGRTVIRYTLDVLMATAENDTDTSPDAGGYINTVKVQGNTLKNADGTDADPQINETIVGP